MRDVGMAGGYGMFTKRGRELIVDLMLAAGWAIYAAAWVIRASQTWALLDLGMLVFVTMVATLFFLRRPARNSGGAWETLVALVGTMLPPAVLRPAPGGLLWLGEPVQLIGLVGMLAAAISLGRSFGIVPADRGLRTTGVYSRVRHPLYAAELCFLAGYVVANPSWRNFAGLIAFATIVVMRILREERILEGYGGYARQVRYRLIPSVW